MKSRAYALKSSSGRYLTLKMSRKKSDGAFARWIGKRDFLLYGPPYRFSSFKLASDFLEFIKEKASEEERQIDAIEIVAYEEALRGTGYFIYADGRGFFAGVRKEEVIWTHCEEGKPAPKLFQTIGGVRVALERLLSLSGNQRADFFGYISVDRWETRNDGSFKDLRNEMNLRSFFRGK